MEVEITETNKKCIDVATKIEYTIKGLEIVNTEKGIPIGKTTYDNDTYLFELVSQKGIKSFARKISETEVILV